MYSCTPGWSYGTFVFGAVTSASQDILSSFAHSEKRWKWNACLLSWSLMIRGNYSLKLPLWNILLLFLCRFTNLVKLNFSRCQWVIQLMKTHWSAVLSQTLRHPPRGVTFRSDTPPPRGVTNVTCDIWDICRDFTKCFHPALASEYRQVCHAAKTFFYVIFRFLSNCPKFHKLKLFTGVELYNVILGWGPRYFVICWLSNYKHFYLPV